MSISSPEQSAERRYADPCVTAGQRLLDGETWTSRTRGAFSSPSSAPIGWYDDPAGSGLLRFFDGTRWTDQVADLPETNSAPDRDATPATVGVAVRRRVLPVVEGLVTRARIRRLGTLLLSAGLAGLLYALWTLGLSNYAADWTQRHLREEIAAAAGTAKSATPAASGSSGTPPGGRSVPVLPRAGRPVGLLVIPRIAMNQVFVAGTGVPDLRKGPGVWRAGVFPGTPGNATISGHRTTYGGPFRHIDRLRPGDRIIVKVVGQKDATFEVRATTIVKPSQVSVTHQVPGVRLTLTSCEPVGSDAERLVVQAELVDGTWKDNAIDRKDWKILH